MELIGQRICMTKDIGVNSAMFGGVMLSIIDESAAVFACKVANTPRMVTLKLNEVLFRKQVKVGMILSVYGDVLKVGNTSMTVKIEVRKHNPRNDEQDVVCETSIVFVHIDEFDQPIAISQTIKDKYKQTKLIKTNATGKFNSTRNCHVPRFLEHHAGNRQLQGEPSKDAS